MDLRHRSRNPFPSPSLSLTNEVSFYPCCPRRDRFRSRDRDWCPSCGILHITWKQYHSRGRQTCEYFTLNVVPPTQPLQNTLTGSQEVAIVIGLLSCASRGSCDTFDVSEVIGSVLYVGPYAPAYQPATPGIGWKPPYQNFTVHVPPAIPKGPASLTVSHFSLVGVSFSVR